MDVEGNMAFHLRAIGQEPTVICLYQLETTISRTADPTL
jgi:hypothetical protein